MRTVNPRLVRPVRFAAIFAALAAAAACTGTSGDRVCVGDTSEALRICAKSSTTVRGIDVSSYQGTVDFTKVKAEGRSFVFVRLASGQNLDLKFGTNWTNAKSAGLIRGAYQYFYPSRDVNVQANLVISTLRSAGFTNQDLPPVLDLENQDGLTPAEVVARAKQWLAKVETELGVVPLVYTAAFMAPVIGQNFKTYPLWVANYNVNCPDVPAGWTEWQFWQTSESGRSNGVSGAVDTDLWNGSLAELQLFATRAHRPADAGVRDSGSDATTDAGNDASRDSGSDSASLDASADASVPDAKSDTSTTTPPGPATSTEPPDPCAPPVVP
jgi:lysozyme